MEELNKIQTELNVPKTAFNAFGKYNYRKAEDILAAVKPLLEKTKCTLVTSDSLMEVGGRIYVKSIATIKNSKGDSESAEGYAREADTKAGMDVAQVTGAASSYARKYALNGLFAIDDTKDPDETNQSITTTHSVITNGAPVASKVETSPGATASKPWLNPNDPKFTEEAKRLASGVSMSTIEAEWRISKNSKIELTTLAEKFRGK